MRDTLPNMVNDTECGILNLDVSRNPTKRHQLLNIVHFSSSPLKTKQADEIPTKNGINRP